MSQQRSMLGRTFGGDNAAEDHLIEEIIAEFTHHPVLNENEIVVTIHDGIVTLEGMVRSPDEKALAEGLAKSVSGARDVTNDISVKGGRAA